ncbi:MAG: hypothetical protein EA403_05670 [Spirochaetaceae bacterium]|nr:MAG: hypothetical protein EA403_05670 [Spirochaetaceae bacterium]
MQDLHREAREVRFYPALTNSVVPTADGPLGYLVVRKGEWVTLYHLELDANMELLSGPPEWRRSMRIDRTAIEPFHVVHTLRDVGGEEKIAVFQYRPSLDSYALIATRNNEAGFVNSYDVDDVASSLLSGDVMVAAGYFAARFAPAGLQFAALSRTAAPLESRPLGFNAGGNPEAGTAVAQGTPPDVPLGFGRVVLAEVTAGETRTVLNVPVDSQFRTFVLYEPTINPELEYLPLGIAGRLETVLASGEILTRTRDRFVVSGPFGQTVGSFPAGDLRFVHERQIDGEWHAVFTLTYWGRRDGDRLLFVRVYVVPSAELGSLR